MEVRELMSAPVATLTIDDTLNCAAKMMRDIGIGCVPIVDRHGVLVGILTDRDIALAGYEIGEAFWRLRIDGSMPSRSTRAAPKTTSRPPRRACASTACADCRSSTPRASRSASSRSMI